MRLAPRITGGFATAFLVLAVLGVVSWMAAREEVRSEAWVSHSVETLQALDLTLGRLTDAETGVRGFVITGDERFLDDWHAGTVGALDSLDQLAALSEDRTEAEQVIKLRALVNQRLGQLTYAVSVRRDLGPHEAAAVVALGTGKRLMDQVRAEVAQQAAEERRQLSGRRAAAAHWGRWLPATIAASCAAMMLLLLLGSYLLTRSITRPIGVIADGARRIGHGELGHRIEVRGSDELAGLAAVFNDMAEKRCRVEAELDATVRASPLAVVSLDDEGRVRLWNSAAEELFGWHAAEVVDQPLPIIPADRCEESKALRARALAGEVIRSVDSVRVARDGTRIDVSLSFAPVRITTGAVVIVEVIKDIRARIAAQAERERLLAGEQQARLALEAVRRTALRIAQRTLEPMPLRHVYQLVVDEARALIDADFGALGIGADPSRPFDEMVYSSVDRHAAPEGDTAVPPESEVGPELGVPVRNHGGHVGYLSFARRPHRPPFSAADQSAAELFAAHAAAAIENARLTQDLHAAMRAREQMLAVVSHDLKNPLAAIAMREQLLAETHSDPALRRHASSSLRSARLMERMVRDLLDSAQIEAGRMVLERQPCDMEVVLDELVEMLQPSAEAHSVRLERRVSGPLEPVSFDRDRLLQVLSNLVSNALAHTPSGGRVLVAVDNAAGALRFLVEDDGEGMPPDVRAHLFERYFTTGRGGRGTGLGLFIVRGIVEAHGGQVHIDSAPGKGTRVIFTIPDELARKRDHSPPVGNAPEAAPAH